MTNDNGAGLRALFHGLCTFWDIEIWDGEQAGEMPGPFDFYLPYGAGVFVVIAPGPADRQAEIGALRQRKEQFVVLDRDDLDNLRLATGPEEASETIGNWIAYGTHGAVMRRHPGTAP